MIPVETKCAPTVCHSLWQDYYTRNWHECVNCPRLDSARGAVLAWCAMRLYGIINIAAILAVLMLLLTGCGAPAPDRSPAIPSGPLPRVLLIGDSISLGYAPYVQASLQGTADVAHIGVNGLSTRFGLANLPAWVGETPWQVIHFNFGLHDIKLDARGNPAVPIEEYTQNLRAIIAALRALQPDAHLVWAATTPVPDTPVTPPRVNADVLRYNAAAAQVMAENQIPVDDLYAFIFPNLAVYQQTADVHFKAAGYSRLATAVSASIRAALAP